VHDSVQQLALQHVSAQEDKPSQGLSGAQGVALGPDSGCPASSGDGSGEASVETTPTMASVGAAASGEAAGGASPEVASGEAGGGASPEVASGATLPNVPIGGGGGGLNFPASRKLPASSHDQNEHPASSAEEQRSWLATPAGQ
jgi:hypothetical protein